MPEFVPWNWEIEPSEEAEVPDPEVMGEVSSSSDELPLLLLPLLLLLLPLLLFELPPLEPAVEEGACADEELDEEEDEDEADTVLLLVLPLPALPALLFGLQYPVALFLLWCLRCLLLLSMCRWPSTTRGANERSTAALC